MRPCQAIQLAFLLGCSGGEIREEGDDGATRQIADGSVEQPNSRADGETSVVDASANPLSGTYKGYIETFKFPDGSDTIVMNLNFPSDGSVTGTVLFGDGPPLAPPTDPNVGYPPGDAGPGGAFVAEGFAFTVLTGLYAAPRVTLQIQHSEVWKTWCELQTTIYPQYNGGQPDGGCGDLLGYGCLPNAATQSGTNCAWSSCDHPMWTAIDCGKLALCGLGVGGACTCTMTSCTVPLGPTADVSFDMQLMAGALNGSTMGIDGSQVLNVHLTHQ